jgi:uncharacterized protein (TIGR02145 family)
MKRSLTLYVSYSIVLLSLIFASCSSTRNIPEFDPSVIGKHEQPCPDMPQFIDPRDSTVYQTVQIGEQCWMKENLRWLPEVTQSRQRSTTEPHYYVLGYYGEDTDKAKKRNNFKHYGALYNWTAAQNACPQGWELPSTDDWEELTDYLINNYDHIHDNNIAASLKSNIQKRPLWADFMSLDPYTWYHKRTNDQTNEFGFSALPAGVSVKQGGAPGGIASWWSHTQRCLDKSFSMMLLVNSNESQICYYPQSTGLSIRCISKGNEPSEQNDISSTLSTNLEDYEDTGVTRNWKQNSCNIVLAQKRSYNYGFIIGLSVLGANLKTSKNLSDYGFENISVSEGLVFHNGILSNYKLNENLDLRFIPTFSFGDVKIRFMPIDKTEETYTQLFDIYKLSFPLALKYTLLPMSITSPYFVGGIGYSYILTAPKAQHNSGGSDETLLSFKSSDWTLDLGIGVQHYFNRFRISTEITASIGLNNLVSGPADDPRFYNAIDRFNSRSIMISFVFD